MRVGAAGRLLRLPATRRLRRLWFYRSRSARHHAGRLPGVVAQRIEKRRAGVPMDWRLGPPPTYVPLANCRDLLWQCLNADPLWRPHSQKRLKLKRFAALPKGAERQLRSQPSSSGRPIAETCSAYSGNLHQKRAFLTKPSQEPFPDMKSSSRTMSS